MNETQLQLALWTAGLPLLGGTLCALLPRRAARAGALLAVVIAAASAVLCVPLARAAWSLSPGDALPGAFWDGRVALRLDALAALGLTAAMGFGFLVALYASVFLRDRPESGLFSAGLLWTLGLAAGAFLAADLLVLLIFWGLLGVTLYLLVGTGGSEAAAAAKKTFIVVGGSDCFLLLGVVLFAFHTGTTRMDGAPMAVAGVAGWTAFLCFVAAAFAKAGGMPLHSWVPDCGEKAPAPVAAFLPASLDKLLGVYLLARVCLGLFRLGGGAHVFLLFLGAGTVVCAVMMALVQHDLKRLLSYHAVSQVGYMVLGLASGSAVGIAGGLFHLLNHAIYKCALFLCAGAVERQAGTTELDRLGGLASRLPATTGAAFVAALAISGVPPLNGFFSKWLVYQGLVEGARAGGGLWVVWLAAAMIGSALTLASFVKVMHAVFLRPTPAALAARSVREAPAAMTAPAVVLAALCVVFGLFAWRLPLRVIWPAVGGIAVLPGNWMPAQAAALLVVAYVLGLLVYRLGSARRPRTCATYVGGEVLGEVRERGPGTPTLADAGVSGADFYRTFEEMPPLSGIYRAAHRKLFDLYDVATRVLFYFVEVFRALHTGNLLVYLAWFLAGLAVVSWLLLKGVGLP